MTKPPSTQATVPGPDKLDVTPIAGDIHVIAESSKEPSTTATVRFDAIDGLRGLACLMVLAFHCYTLIERYQVMTFNVGGNTYAISDLLIHGYSGVDLFFVLSGFCLSFPIFSKPNRPVDWKRYAINRARRLLPPYYAAVLFFGTLAFVIHKFQIAPFYGRVLHWPSPKEFAYTLSLFHFSLNGSFWTLILEWRWYFIFPIFIFLALKGVRSSWMFLATIPISAFFLFVFAQAETNPAILKLRFITTELPSVLPLFAFGIWAAEITANTRRSRFEQLLIDKAPWGLIASLILTAIVAKAGNHVHWTRLVTWGPVFFFLILATLHSTNFSRVFSWRPLVKAGIFSYSLYLVHDPLLRSADLVIRPYHLTPWMKFFVYQGLVFWSLVGIGYLFFLVAEQPFIRKAVKKVQAVEGK